MDCHALFAAGYLLSLREPLVSSLHMGCSYGRGCFLKTDAKAPTLSLSWPGMILLGRPSVAGPVFARVFGPQTGVQKNHFFRSLEGAKSLENL